MNGTVTELEELLSRVALTTMTFFFQITGEITRKEPVKAITGSGELTGSFLNIIASLGYIEKGEEGKLKMAGEELVMTSSWTVVDEEGLRRLLTIIETAITKGKQELSPGKRRWHREPR